MGEIKHSFTAGRMNKDVDERLVKNGEYRDANNIQVRTTDGGGDGVGDAGVVQNLQGNIAIGFATGTTLSEIFSNTDFKCVGSIPYEKNDTIYFFFTSTASDTTIEDLQSLSSEVYEMDFIVELNTITNETNLVVVDYYSYLTPLTIGTTDMVWTNANQPSGAITSFQAVTSFRDKIRVNSTLTFGQSSSLTNTVEVKVKKIETSGIIHFYDEVSSSDWSAFDLASATHPRVLEFDKDNNINSINVIDNLLFWTDNVNEPKKINIDRCKDGTNNDGIEFGTLSPHTQLRVKNPLPTGPEYITPSTPFTGNQLLYNNNDLLLKHVTVLRPAPKTPPTIDISVRNVNELQFTITNFVYPVGPISMWNITNSDPWSSGEELAVGPYINGGGDEFSYGEFSPAISDTSFLPGDVMQVTQENVEDGFDPITFTVEVIGYTEVFPQINAPLSGGNGSVPTDRLRFKYLTEPSGDITVEMTDWNFEAVLTEKPKFELKFARFGYRYKYTDGEYSAFSPWSEIAFDPGVFDYDPVHGYNLGMVNTISGISIKDFIPYYTDRGHDIVEVEILYKSTESPNVYTVKRVRKEIDGEWELFTPNYSEDDGDQWNSTQPSIGTGKLTIKTEMIHRVLPANQTLRTFDNVPRKALAQEITGSRVLYGNFTQGFDVSYPVGLNQIIESETVDVQPKRSVKTIRDYKVGMVFGDKLGRETPVIASSKFSELEDGEFEAETNDVYVAKQLCAMSNKLQVQQDWNVDGMPASTPESMEWMDYVKYYVKETSDEYYNLVLDRWYFAKEENNIWLSFPSADRNKVDLETYLYLKKEHGGQGAVLEPARYKVIAIENEAPDFIKTDRRSMGMCEISDPDATNPNEYVVNPPNGINNNDPNLLTDPENGKKINISEANWDGFLESYGQNMRGQLYSRVVGRTINEVSGVTQNELNSGEFKKVTHHYYSDTNSRAAVMFNESFLDSANMRDRFETIFGLTSLNITEASNSANDLRYYLEFVEDVVENKPEFDGRFFVLIEKDLALEENVTKVTTSAVTFTEIDSFGINYIDTQQWNPASSGPYSIYGEGNPTFTSNGGVIGVNSTTGTDVGGYQNAGPQSSGVLDFTQNPAEWWGWGYFSWLGNMTSADYDSSASALFALGCDAEAYGKDYIDNFGNNNSAKTANYARLTRNYWTKYVQWHTSDPAANMEDVDDLGLQSETGVFLDSARASRFDLAEMGDNISSTSEGDMALSVFIASDGYVSNDADLGVTPQSVTNYKPTGLDRGGAEAGTFGRMILSQIHDLDNQPMDPPTGNPFAGPSATQLYTYFSSTDTYFQFIDDKSDTSDSAYPDGKPYTYKVVHTDVEDPTIQLEPQMARYTRNHGQILNAWPSYDADTDTTSYAPDNDRRSVVLSVYRQPPVNWNGSTFASLGGYPVNFAGHNDIWFDETNNQQNDIFSSLPIEYRQGVTGTYGDEEIRVGAGKNDGTSEGEYYKDWKVCKACDNGVMPCHRASLRFEFRRVDSSSDTITNKGIVPGEFDPRGWAKHDGTQGDIRIRIVQKSSLTGGSIIDIEEDKGVWETEPKENVGLDIYYEATHAIPQKLYKGNLHAYAPLKAKVKSQFFSSGGGSSYSDLLVDIDGNNYTNVMVGGGEYTIDKTLVKVISTNASGVVDTHPHMIAVGDNIVFVHTSGLETKSKVLGYYKKVAGNSPTYVPSTEFTVDVTLDAGTITTTEPQGTITLSNYQAGFSEANVTHGMSVSGEDVPGGKFLKYFVGVNIQLSETLSWLAEGQTVSVTLTEQTGYIDIDTDVYKYKVNLGWHNCYSFGNGVESDRIRDDFNAPQIDNGIKVSATSEGATEEKRSSSLIFSGLYNSTSSVNDLNEFNMGEGIIKDLNPEYGTVQALKTRDTDVVAFCEDRILKVQANKEAVFMADNDPSIVATDRVLGTISTFKGDYGISKNPESLASDQYRLYFTDTQRGAVIRVSMDGITPISNVGMKTWFRENLRGASKLLGTFDKVNGEYNLTIDDAITVSFNEVSKGWVSFKSFIPDEGTSVSGKYFTVKDATIYQHYVDTFDDDGIINNRNLFYGETTLLENAQSTLTVMFNDMPGSVKNFRAMNYEGSQARIDQNLTDSEYYNLYPKKGWWVSDIHTDLQEGKIYWFVDKENKWFNKICGTATTLENLDTSEFTVQGIGSPTNVEFPVVDEPQTFTFTIENED